jgi:hypothetical protein
MVRFFIFTVLVFIQWQVAAQVKKSHFGTYTGKIGSYEINTGMERIEVGASDITIELGATNLSLKIGNTVANGTWKLILETKTYYLIEASMEKQAAPEKILIYKKRKKLFREGIRPQPDVMLTKQKR